MQETPWADIQDAVDAMSSAISACADGEWSREEMWAEIDAQCQVLARMAVVTDDEEHEDEDEDDGEDIEGLNFDDERRKEDCSDFEDDEDLN